MPAKKEVDWDKLDILMQYKPSLIDAAELMGMKKTTLQDKIKEKDGCTFREYRVKKMAKTRTKLVQTALKQAYAGNSTMLIFCLKNLCGWVDKLEHSGDDKKPPTLNIKLNGVE